MGDVGNMFLKSIPFVGGFLGDDADGPDDPAAPKTARQLSREADKIAEQKRLARVEGKEGSKTMFSDPLVNAGMPLKEKLGV
jgi:hypothetical protein